MATRDARNRVHTPLMEVSQTNATNFFEEANIGNEEAEQVRQKFLIFADEDGVQGDPSAGKFMLFAGFTRCMQHYQCCSDRKLQRFFRAMDTDGDSKLSFPEFFMGVCAADPATTHILNSFTGLERTKFIFNFYTDSSNGELMNFDEFVQVHVDLNSADKSEARKDDARRDAMEKARELRLLDHTGNFKFVSQADLCKFIQTEKIRGTSRLFRFNKSLFKGKRGGSTAAPGGGSTAAPGGAGGAGPVAATLSYTAPEKSEAIVTQAVAPQLAPLLGSGMRGRAPIIDQLSDPSVEYETLDWHAALLDVDSRQSDQCPGPPPSGRPPEYTSLFPVAPPPGAQSDHAGNFQEDPVAIALKVLGYLASDSFDGLLQKGISGSPEDDGVVQFVAATGVQFRTICAAVVVLLQAEDMVVNVSGLPVKVFGALHGQLLDLLSHFKWTGVPSRGSPWVNDGDLLYNNYLFLGDYVDRGSYSLEVLLLLFCMKVVRPNGVFLLRGQHENRHFNRHLGLWDECQCRLGRVEGARLYDCLDHVFEHMSLAAVVHGRFLAVGAGALPETLSSLDQLRQLEKPLQLPHVNQPPFSDDASQDLLSELFTPGPLFYTKGNQPDPVPVAHLEWFCAKHRLDALIVGHGLPSKGCDFALGGKLISLTSCLNYCDEYGNDAAVLQIILRSSTQTGYNLPRAFDFEVRRHAITARMAPVYKTLSQSPDPRTDVRPRWPTQIRSSTPGRRSICAGGGDDRLGHHGVLYKSDGKVEPLVARVIAGGYLPAYGPGRPPGGLCVPRRPQSAAVTLPEPPPCSAAEGTAGAEASGTVRRDGAFDYAVGEAARRPLSMGGLRTPGGSVQMQGSFLARRTRAGP